MGSPKRPGVEIPGRRLNGVDLERADALLAEDTPEARRQEVRALQAKVRLDQFVRSIPARFAEAQLSDLDMLDDGPRSAITRWLESDHPTLILVGDTGVGKTHTAYAVLRQAAASGVWVAGCEVIDLLRSLKPHADDSPLPRLAEMAPLFLFDDLAAHRSSDWVVEEFGGIISRRTREERRQIITTNVTYDVLDATLGRRTMSRLMGGAVTVQVGGSDRRKTTW
jgi:DNA replication protein DnaC